MGRGVADIDAPLSLDDEELFGPTLYRETFADAVAAGRLVDYDVEVLAVRAGDGEDPGRPGGVEAVLAAAAEGATRILTFHSRISHARELTHELDGHRLPDGRTVHAEHLEARHRSPRRSAALQRLAQPGPGTVAVLASARILTEGIDVPAVDTVVFAEPRTSPVDIVQAVGRAMRLAPGKDRGRVVLAVTTGGGGLDEDTELSGGAWRHVWITLRALASMDPRFAARLQATLTPGGDGGYRGGPGLTLDLPHGLDLNRWMLRALDRTGGGWWHLYDLLTAHAREHGNARPGKGPQSTRGGAALGPWVARQRTLHRQGSLEQDRVDALEQLPGWAWSARDTAWWRAAAVWDRLMGTSLRPGSDEEGDRLLHTPGWGAAEGYEPVRSFRNLAEFLVDTCARQRRGELPPHLEAAANQLSGWRWNVVDADDARMVDALAEYGAWRRDLNPPHDYRHDDDLPLGAWLTAIRRRHYTGRLSPALELELAAIARHDWAPLRWDKAETGWRLGYLALRQYVAREATTRIPTDHLEALPDHELNLSRWCIVQRLERRHDRLAGDRVAALEQIRGWRWEIPVRPQTDRHVLNGVEHGARRAYAAGCRCDRCTDANTEHARLLLEQGTDLVDAGPAREHLQRLGARGATQKGMARAAGVNVKSIVATQGGEVSRIRPDREQLLLGLTLQAAAEHTEHGLWGEKVPAGPTWKLIDWMVLRGWPKAWIAREIGQNGRALQLDRHRISKTNAEAVAELDHRLGRTRRPPTHRRRDAPLPTLDEILASEQVA